jgi:hypothetical protein
VIHGFCFSFCCLRTSSGGEGTSWFMIGVPNRPLLQNCLDWAWTGPRHRRRTRWALPVAAAALGRQAPPLLIQHVGPRRGAYRFVLVIAVVNDSGTSGGLET